MNSFSSSHRDTKFDIACEEKQEYDKTYDTGLSYGYYSAYKETGNLPKDWYEHLIDVQKSMPENFNESIVEYQEYKRRFHKRIRFNEYIQKRDSGKLNKKWYLYLIESTKWIPRDFKSANTEYYEYLNAFKDNISFYEYFEKKEKGELPVEWYQFLIQLEKSIEDLIQISMM